MPDLTTVVLNVAVMAFMIILDHCLCLGDHLDKFRVKHFVFCVKSRVH